jgi:hypothetical protein
VQAAQVLPAQTAQVQAAPGGTMAAAMQLAIALLTAGLDSPELAVRREQSWSPIRVSR